MTKFVSHLEGAIDGTRIPVDQIQTLHKDHPLWVRWAALRLGVVVESELRGLNGQPAGFGQALNRRSWEM